MGIRHSKQPTVSSKDKAILDLKVQRDKLKQYERKVRIEETRHGIKGGTKMVTRSKLCLTGNWRLLSSS